MWQALGPYETERDQLMKHFSITIDGTALRIRAAYLKAEAQR